MDDYNINVLSEAKNEYSCRLLSILTPVVIDGVKSIFNDAERLCIENDEDDKYLMTFQNFYHVYQNGMKILLNLNVLAL